ncbi:Predicted membrane protein [Ceraceosorus bombacis]|uniref:Predicted membrane protein n=1 Tax=Ceraceosorus bombacis TaxID=401625 RepID=A0A0P1BD08_9BASI|nr:Predicted membrane protein [Ceraceosorus bombacis]
MRSSSLFSLLSCALLLCTSSVAIFPFKSARFSANGLVSAGSLGLGPSDGAVVSLGDFDADQFVDYVTLSPDSATIKVWTWDHHAFKFRTEPYATLKAPSGWSVVNVVSADFDYDGRLDILLVLKHYGSRMSDHSETRLQLWNGDSAGGFKASPIELPSAGDAQPLIFDDTGDMKVDLLGQAWANPSASDSASSGLKIWRNNLGAPNGSFAIENAPLQHAPGTAGCRLASPHSSAFIDLDGDCLADLFLVCEGEGGRTRYEVHTASKRSKSEPFKLSLSGHLPMGAGALSFADMDRDGTMDVVFPACDSKGCSINIAHNRQMPLCKQEGGWFGPGPGGPAKSQSKLQKAAANVGARQSTWSARDASSLADPADASSRRITCRTPESLCTKDEGFSFDFEVGSANSDITTLPLTAIVPEAFLALDNTLASPAVPLALSIGDFNKDGFPDLVIVTLPDHNRPDHTRVRLLKNVACSSGKSGCPPEGWEASRTFEVVTIGAEVLETLDDVRSATFLDIDEDGTLDLMLQRQVSAKGGARGAPTTVTFVQNNYFHDAFFLKAVTLNGACIGYCEPSDGPRFKPRAVNYAGASYKFTVLDTNGVRRAQQVGQLPQHTYRSLQPPYSYFGLGRTNNYVESLFVGSTRRQPQHFLAMEGVVPNSHVVVVPWQDANAADGGDPGQWHKELYLSPADWIPAVTAVLVCLILLLATIVFVLHMNERREDERERKRAVHAINFDAL